MNQLKIHLKIVPIEEAFDYYEIVLKDYLDLKKQIDKNNDNGIKNPELEMNHDNMFQNKNALLFP